MGGDIDPNSKLSDSKAFLIIIKCFVGGGMLSLPFALAHAGLVLGVVCMATFACLSIQGILMLAECSLLLQRERNVAVSTYPQLAMHISGSKNFGRFVSLTVCLTQLGVCCVMVNFVSTNVLAILPCETRQRLMVVHSHDGNEIIKILEEPQCFGLDPLPAKRRIIGMVLPVFVALSWLPSIKALAPLAKVANYFMLFTIIVILFYAARSYYYVGLATSCVAWPPDLDSFSLFIGNCFYSFEGVATMIPLCAAMENQGSVKRVLRNALLSIMALQLTVAVTCYVSFQDIDNASMTAVLASNRRIEVPIYTVFLTNCFVICAVVFTFPLQLFPAMQLLESFFGIAKKPKPPPASFPSTIQNKNEKKDAAEAARRPSPAHFKRLKSEESTGDENDGARPHWTKSAKNILADDKSKTTGKTTGDAPAAVTIDSDEELVKELEDLIDDGNIEPPAQQELDDDYVPDYDGKRMIDAYDSDNGGDDWDPVADSHGSGPTPRCLPCCQLIFRTFVVLLIGCITYMIPDLGLIVDLFGAVFGSTLAIIVPNYLSIQSSLIMGDPGERERQDGSRLRKRVIIAVVFCCAAVATKAVLAEMASGEVRA